MFVSRFHADKAYRKKHYFSYVFGFRQRKCGACNGSGRYDNHGSPKCGACEGTGKERYAGPKAIQNLQKDTLTEFTRAATRKAPL